MFMALQYARETLQRVLFFLIFFLIVTPTAFVMRLTGRDRLQLRTRGKASLFKKRDHVFSGADLERAF